MKSSRITISLFVLSLTACSGSHSDLAQEIEALGGPNQESIELVAKETGLEIGILQEQIQKILLTRGTSALEKSSSQDSLAIFDPRICLADPNHDGLINLHDLGVLGKQFGRSCLQIALNDYDEKRSYIQNNGCMNLSQNTSDVQYVDLSDAAVFTMYFLGDVRENLFALCNDPFAPDENGETDHISAYEEGIAYLSLNPSKLDTDSNGISDLVTRDSADFDNDGVRNIEDNCVITQNPDQTDSDSNGIGDACSSPTDDGDCSVSGTCEVNPLDPAIFITSGSFNEDSVVTISGSDFGASHSMDIEWTGGPNGMIENTAVDTQANGWGDGWRIGISSDVTPAKISTLRAHSHGKAIRAYVDSTPNSYNSGFAFEPGRKSGMPTNFKEIYATWWTYFDPQVDDGNCSNLGPQWKMWRINATADYNASSNNFLGEVMSSGNWNLSGNHRTELYSMIWAGPVPTYDCVANPTTCYPWAYPDGTLEEHWHTPNLDDARKWVRWEVYLKASSTPGVKDGTYVYRALVPGSPTWKVEWEGNVGTHRALSETPGVSVWGAYTRMVWQNYWGNCGRGAEWFQDDIYLQFGNRARIEIGDSPNFDTCTHREIQEPISWSSESIQFKVNYGSFQPGDNVYLFVVRDDGRRSPGKAIRLP